MSGAITAATIAAVGISAAGSVATGVIGANAAGNAADAQASAANKAAQLQYDASQNALGFQKQQYNTNQAQMQPWLQSGTGAASQLDYLLGITPQGTAQRSAAPSDMSAPGVSGTGQSSPAPSGTSMPGMQSQARSSAAPGGMSMPGSVPGSGLAGSPPPTQAPFSATPGASGTGSFGSLMTPYSGTFTAPTGLSEQNDPGYQARLQLGTQALQQSAAARGNVVTGGTANDLNKYAQDYASNEYGNVYNRALSTYGTNYNQYQQQQAKQFNQLAAISGAGQQAAEQLGTAGQNSANAISSNVLGTAQNMGNAYQNAGAATASGYVGQANAINGAISGGTSNLSNLALMGSMPRSNPYMTLSNAQNSQNSTAGQALMPTTSSYGGYI